MNRRNLFRVALGAVAAALPIKAAAREPQIEYLTVATEVVGREIDWFDGHLYANVGDRVQLGSGSGWGYDGHIGMVTNRSVLDGAHYLGELAEVTFDDGFALWCGDENLTIVEHAA